MHSAKGKDKVAYETILSLDQTALLKLLQKCIDLCELPSAWTEAIIAAIPKKGKPPDNPNSYRVIGLQSCFLKLLTLLIDRRLREWSDSIHLIPDSQNGFRPGYRTNNNSYILRCAIDKAKSEHEPLFVAFIDLSNAFPSTNHSALWWKLHSKGAAGPIIDWLRHLYREVSYEVRLDGEYSEVFKSLVGILAGDPASPHLWNIFLSDFNAPEHPCDITLNGRPISSLAQADDIALFCKSHAGLQLKINALYQWCAINFLIMNFVKSVFMMFALADYVPSLHVGGKPLTHVTEYVYVGIAFSSKGTNIFAPQYSQKAIKARRITSATLGLESHVGVIPPMEGRKLYMACVDPHLTFGAELIVDVQAAQLLHLQNVQHRFFRRLLGLNPRSMLAPLFTETAVMPIQYRRLILTLRYLKHLLMLPDRHYAKAAFLESVSLLHRGHPSWFGDICILGERLCPESFPLHHRGTTLSPQIVDDLIRDATNACDSALQAQIDASPKTYLLAGRREKNEKGVWTLKTLAFRHYLYVQIPEHRLSLTRLLLSDHCLASEQLRRATRYRQKIPSQLRICRFCKGDIEDPLHAMLTCTGNVDITALRSEFLRKAREVVRFPPEAATSPHAFFLALYQDRMIVNVLARFVHKVLNIYKAVPILLPAAAPTAPIPGPSMD